LPIFDGEWLQRVAGAAGGRHPPGAASGAGSHPTPARRPMAAHVGNAALSAVAASINLDWSDGALLPSQRVALDVRPAAGERPDQRMEFALIVIWTILRYFTGLPSSMA